MLNHLTTVTGAPDPNVRAALRAHPARAGGRRRPRHAVQPRRAHVRAAVLQRSAGSALRATAAPAPRHGPLSAAHDGEDPRTEHATRSRTELSLRDRLYETRDEGALLLAACVGLQ